MPPACHLDVVRGDVILGDKVALAASYVVADLQTKRRRSMTGSSRRGEVQYASGSACTCVVFTSADKNARLESEEWCRGDEPRYGVSHSEKQNLRLANAAKRASWALRGHEILGRTFNVATAQCPRHNVSGRTSACVPNLFRPRGRRGCGVDVEALDPCTVDARHEAKWPRRERQTEHKHEPDWPPQRPNTMSWTPQKALGSPVTN
ncbi:hypothetical protein BJV77DRAFT_963361 [Russula vinacea]|nr:hypothetical protein BJV77DRAFT_963361 [Russula vinacea]